MSMNPFHDPDFDFEGAMNVANILNDKSLQDELVALGFDTEEKIAQKTKTVIKTQLKSNNKQEFTEFDISNIGNVDETNLEMTEDDFNDPSLLNEFASLNGEKEVQGTEPPDSDENEKSTNPFQEEEQQEQEIYNPPPPQIPDTFLPGPITASEAKQKALHFKREGNNTEALKWYRYAKQLDSKIVNSASSAPRPASTKIRTQNKVSAKKDVNSKSNSTNSSSKNGSINDESSSNAESNPVSATIARTLTISDSYSPLEEALKEASNSSLREAKQFEHTDKKKAIEFMKEYKHYQQELLVLQARRQGGGVPPVFQWERIEKQITVENLDIGENEIKVIISGLHDIEGALGTHKSRSISVRYNLGIGATKDEPPISLSPVDYNDGKAEFNYEALLPVLKRGKFSQQVYSRKKATFEFTLHRGFFKSNILLCMAVLPLSDLLTKTECGGVLPLFGAEKKEGGVKKGKAVGGSLHATLRIRTPLSGPELRTVVEKKLIVAPWPDLSHSTTVNTNSTKEEDQKVQTQNKSQKSEDNITTSGVNNSGNKSETDDKFSSLTEKEKTDPHSVDLIESNDVLDAEISVLQQSISKGGSGDEDQNFNDVLRLQLLQGKLQVLVLQVQNETLSFTDYLELLKGRVERDKLMALFFKSQGTPERTKDALKIMRRINIMKKEIQNAEESMES